MQFIEFVPPHGKKRIKHMDVSEETERLVKELEDAGFRFELELLRLVNQLSIECCAAPGSVNHTKDGDPYIIAHEIVANGTDVLCCVQRLVTDAHASWKSGFYLNFYKDDE